MSKIARITVIACLASCSLLRSENLLLNSSFEQGEPTNADRPASWTVRPDAGYGKIEKETAAEGRHSVVFDVPHGTDAQCSFTQWQNVLIPAGTKIKLSGWSKTADLRSSKEQTPSRGLFTSVQLADGSRVHPAVGAPASSEWRYVEKFFSYPKDVIKIAPITVKDYNISGKVWYDSVYFGPWSEQDAQAERLPRLRIPQVTTPFELDGNLDDPCWKIAAKLADFRVVNKEKFAANPTEVYIGYDNDNFYIATKCFSTILDPALQMLDQFSAKETARDGSVFRDDSIEIFISTPDGDYFQFAFNALGTQYDGHKMEKAWNHDWTVNAEIGDGAWTAEVVIPFRSLGINPESDKGFGINICRNDRAGKEASSWSDSPAGFHDVDNFAAGTFGKIQPQVSTDSLPIGLINLGLHTFPFVIRNATNEPAHVRLNLELITEDGHVLLEEVRQLQAGEASHVVIKSDLNVPGDGSYRYRLTDLITGAELLRSPFYGFRTNAILQVKNNISFPGEVQLFLNGKKITKETFFLEKGTNEIVANFTGTGEIGGDIEIMPSTRSLAEKIPLAGNAEGELQIKKNILIESTQLFPFDIEAGIWLEPEAAQHIRLDVPAPADKELQVLVPKELELIDFEEGVLGETEDFKTKMSFGEEHTIDEIQYKMYNFEYTCSPATKLMKQMLLVTMPKPSSKSSLSIYFRVQDSKSIEAWRKLQILPLNQTLAGKRPRELKIELWHTFIGRLSVKQVEKILETFAQTGFNEYVERIMCYGRDLYLKPLRDNGFKINAEFHSEHQISALVRKYPEEQARNFENKTSSRLKLKPSFICGKGRDEFSQIITDFALKYHPDSIIIDMEKSSIADCDTSPESLDAFTKFAGLPETPTTEQILNDYRTEWGDFMCLQWSEIAKVVQEGIKKADPNIEFSIYSSYQSPRNKMKYSIDWSLMRGIVDFAEMGYGRQPQEVRDATFKALGEIPAATGVLFYATTPLDINKTLKNKILRRITDGAKGITFYNWAKLDGFARAKVSEACAILADYEDFFLKNEQSHEFSVEGDFGADEVVLLKYKDKMLVLVFNGRDKKRHGRISLSGKGPLQALRYGTGETFTGNVLDVAVDAMDTAVFELSRQ